MKIKITTVTKKLLQTLFLIVCVLVSNPDIIFAGNFLWEQSNVGIVSTGNWTSISSSADGTKIAAVVQSGYIYTSADSGATWSARLNAGSREWTSVAMSADGTKIVATAAYGYIYTSTDSGTTWTAQTDAGTRYWFSVTSSSDGTKLAAAVSGGYIYTSSDSGLTWTERTGAGSASWGVDCFIN